jgi:hypothetical protein
VLDSLNKEGDEVLSDEGDDDDDYGDDDEEGEIDEETRQKLLEQGYDLGDDDEEAEFDDLGDDDEEEHTELISEFNSFSLMFFFS